MDQQTSPSKHKPIESPTGIDLNPKAPGAVRVSKRAGIVVVSVLAGIGALFGYGIYERHANQMQAALADDGRTSLHPAESAAKEIKKDIPAGTVTASRNGARRTDMPDLDDPKSHHSERSKTSHTESQSQNLVHAARVPAQSVQPVVPVQQSVEPTPEQKRLATEYERELQAMTAPTAIQSGYGMQGSTAVPSGSAMQTQAPAPSLDDIQHLLRKLRGADETVSSTNSREYPSEGRYDQSDKEHSLAQARGSRTNDYLDSARTAPVSKYEIKAGWNIPAVLEQALNSDLPGAIRALVAENVYDTATGRYLLIPQGSRLIGTYDSHVVYGQNGVQVIWTRIIFPDASSIDLSGMVGQDAGGAAGLRDKVDNHIKRVVGYSILSSVLSAGFELTQSRSNRGLLQYPSIGDTAEGAVGQELGHVGSQLTQRQLNIQPTIKIPVGFKFNVRVSHDILFDASYSAQ